MIIGLAGRAGAGKDTVATMVLDLSGRGDEDSFIRTSFAGPLKDICMSVYDFTWDQLHGADKEKPDHRYPRPDGTFLTAREAMQKLGTEWARACYPNTWIDLAMRKAQKMGNIVITDVRFLNEARAIKDHGGEVWRVYRETADRVPAVHQSEKEIDLPEFLALQSRQLFNNGTLAELKKWVEVCLTR